VSAAAAAAFLTTMATIFVAELTDKDAIFLLALATKTRASVVFVSGSVAFFISTAIIVAFGSLLIEIVPVFYIKLAGGAIMLGYAVFEYYGFSSEKKRVDEREESLLDRAAGGAMSVILPAVISLILLDLAGDATEVVTIVFLAHFQDAIAVFGGAVVGLIGAVAVETAIGNRLGRILAPARVRHLSIAIFLVIGSLVIATTLL
jgi:putative Ca2+/H+ antiporter (TMEM165/GDT1 family)